VKKIYGYGWRKSSESIASAYEYNYCVENLNDSLADAKADFLKHQKEKECSSRIKPIFFRLILEDCE